MGEGQETVVDVFLGESEQKVYNTIVLYSISAIFRSFVQNKVFILG